MNTTVFLLIIGVVVVGATATPALFDLNEAPAPAPNSTLDYLNRALAGLGRALGFFQRVYTDVNLDAIIGTRIVEATFTVLLQRLEASDLLTKVPPYIVAQIQQLRGQAHDISESAIPYVIASEPSYYAKLGPILSEGLFELDYDSRDLSPSVTSWPHTPEEQMYEESSDDCIAELAGTKTGKTCAITNGCWEKMTAIGYNRYSLSHEIFYLELAERFGCQPEMAWHIAANNQGSLRRLHDIFCANMLTEANTIAEDRFLSNSRDLFMEQAGLCGMLGYRDFFNSDWLLNILNWQDPADGCYKWSGWSAHKRSDSTRFHHTRRYKREEKRVSRGCLCHRTTVAASALVQYVRYILEVWFQEQL